MLDNVDILRQAYRPGDFSVRVEDTASKEVQKGVALGMEVELMEDPLADLMDSMEELSGQFEEKTMKDIGTRKLGKENRKVDPKVAAVEKWMKLLPDMPQGQFLDRLLKQLRTQSGERTSPKELLKLLSRESNDATHLHAMLDILKEALADDPAARKQLRLVQDAQKQLDAERGPEVKAGLNLAEEINARGSTPSEIRGLRDLYRNEVLGFEKPQECFRSLLASRGAGRLGEAIEFLMKGAGIDLQSADPSRSPEELRSVILDLQAVNVLRTMLEQCDGLTAKMLREFGETSLLNGEGLAGKIVDLTEQPFTSAADVAQLLQACGFAQLLAKLYFTTRLTELFRGLSPRLFGEEGDRFQLVDAAQEHLDGLVAQQEEAEKKAARKGGEAA